jgi:hypothetical protein
VSEDSDLTVLLHRRTDDLPVFVRGASGLRRAAERGRRRRRITATAFSTVVAVVVGAAAVLGGPGGGSVTPPPAETPTPAPSGVARGLLAPEDLPTGVPFGAWTGYTDHTEPSVGPFCVDELTAAGADQWLVRAFETDAAGVEGYQAVVRFTSVDTAKQAGSELTYLAICGPRSKSNFAYGADGQGGGRGQNSPAISPGDPVISLAWARSQQYLSVTWLSWHSAVLLTDPVQDALWQTVQDRLDRATPDLAAPDPTVAEQAMLVAANVPSPAGRVANLTGTPFTYFPLHSCDFDVADAAPLRQVLLGDDHFRDLAGERLVLASDEPSAQAMVSELQNRIRSCDTPSQMQAHDGTQRTDAHETSLPAVGDDAWGWQYDRTLRGGEQDRVYVAIVREGPLVAQVVRILQQGDPAPAAFQELVTTAADRLAAHSDELAQRDASDQAALTQ